MTKYTGHHANPPRKTVHVTPGNVRAVAVLDATGIRTLQYLHAWIEHASALAFQAKKIPSPRLTCAASGVMRRALQLYAEHLDNLPDTDEAKVSEFLDTAHELARPPLPADVQQRISATLDELDKLDASDAPGVAGEAFPRWREVLRGQSDAQREAEAAAFDARVAAYLPKRLRTP